MAIPTSDTQALAPGSLIEMFEIDTSPIEPLTPNIYRIHSGVSLASQELHWQGQLFQRFPVETKGYEYTGKGALPRPTVRIANITGMLGTLNRTKSNLVGAKVTRHRTFTKYLDRSNYTSFPELEDSSFVTTSYPGVIATSSQVTEHTITNGNNATVAWKTICNKVPLPNSGLYYWEISSTTFASSALIFGITDQSYSLTGYPGSSPYSLGLITNTRFGTQIGGVETATGYPWAAFSPNDVFSVLVNMDASLISFYKNGSLIVTRSLPVRPAAVNLHPAISVLSGADIYTINYGQVPFKVKFLSTGEYTSNLGLPKVGGTGQLDIRYSTNQPYTRVTKLNDGTVTALVAGMSYVGAQTVVPVGLSYYYEATILGYGVGGYVDLGVAPSTWLPNQGAASTIMPTVLVRCNATNALIYNLGVVTALSLGALPIGSTVSVSVSNLNITFRAYTPLGVLQATQTVAVAGWTGIRPFGGVVAVGDSFKFEFGNLGFKYLTNSPVAYYQAFPLQGNENTTSNPAVFFPPEVYFVNRLVVENRVLCEYELSSSLEVQGIKLPKRQIINNTCQWKYRGAECTYVGGAVGDLYDNVIVAPALVSAQGFPDNCSKTLTGCRLRFPAAPNGVFPVLPFGGFPGSGLV